MGLRCARRSMRGSEREASANEQGHILLTKSIERPAIARLCTSGPFGDEKIVGWGNIGLKIGIWQHGLPVPSNAVACHTNQANG